MDAQRMIFERKHRLVLPAPAVPGDGAAVARQLDSVMMSLGFKCSGELMGALSRLEPGCVIDQAVKVIGWARELAGVHVAHNTYFVVLREFLSRSVTLQLDTASLFHICSLWV